MSSHCETCQAPKAKLQCGICEQAVCRKCVQFLEKDSFAWLSPKPVPLTHETYCPACFIREVAPALEEYEAAVLAAKDVLVFTNSRGDESRPVKSSEKPLRVEDCLDQKETLLRLAFLAARKQCNALIDVSITSKKVRNGGYESSRFYGVATPARVNREKFPLEEKRGSSLFPNPN